MENLNCLTRECQILCQMRSLWSIFCLLQPIQTFVWMVYPMWLIYMSEKVGGKPPQGHSSNHPSDIRKVNVVYDGDIFLSQTSKNESKNQHIVLHILLCNALWIEQQRCLWGILLFRFTASLCGGFFIFSHTLTRGGSDYQRKFAQ